MKRTSLEKEAGDERRRPWSALLRRLGATRLGVWVIKHVVSPLDRWLYQRTSGRRVALGRPLGPLLRLTTTGRRTGKEHTTPVYYVRDGTRLVLCNVNPGFQHSNPWTLPRDAQRDKLQKKRHLNEADSGCAVEVPYDCTSAELVKPVAAFPLLAYVGHCSPSRGGLPQLKKRTERIGDLFSSN